MPARRLAEPAGDVCSAPVRQPAVSFRTDLPIGCRGQQSKAGERAGASEMTHRGRRLQRRCLRFWLAEEAKIETQQKQDEVDDGTAGADHWCFDKACADQRYRHIGEVEIDKYARRTEEGAREELPNFTAAPGKIESRDSHADSCSDVYKKNHAGSPAARALSTSGCVRV